MSSVAGLQGVTDVKIFFYYVWILLIDCLGNVYGFLLFFLFVVKVMEIGMEIGMEIR